MIFHIKWYSFFFILFFVVINSANAAMEKPRIALKPPSIGNTVNKNARRHLDVEVLAAEMEAALQGTRKFEILNRNKGILKAVRDEQQLVSDEIEISGANYLVVTDVQDFVFYRKATPIPNIGNKYTRVDSGQLVLNVKIIDVKRNAVKMAFNLKDTFSTNKKVVNKRGGTPSRVHYLGMAKKIAGKMADKLIDAVFPMVVIKAKDKKIWINRGQDGGLKKGDALNVYRVGEELIDPYTKEKLGADEEYVGKVTVDRVNPKFTIAILKSSNSGFAQGDILRRP